MQRETFLERLGASEVGKASAELPELAESSVRSLQARAEDINLKIDDLLTVAARIVDNFKDRLMEQMERLREEVLDYQAQQTENWIVSSADIQDCVGRLQSVQSVIQGLNNPTNPL